MSSEVCSALAPAISSGTESSHATGEVSLRIEIEGVDPEKSRALLEALFGGSHPDAGLGRLTVALRSARAHRPALEKGVPARIVTVPSRLIEEGFEFEDEPAAIAA